MRSIFLILSVLILNGCALNTWQNKSVNHLDSITPKVGKASETFLGDGFQVFRCIQDAKGTYWRFEQPIANLSNTHGEFLIKHSGPMMAFDHADGSRILSSRILSWVNPQNPSNDIKPVLMEAITDPGSGFLNDVRYVQRINTKGGIPQKNCTTEEVGHLLKVPFKAEYIFWKN